MMERPDLVAVAAALGMQRLRTKKWNPCPACGYDGPDPAVVLGRGFWCGRCDARGDVYDLVCYAIHGHRVSADRPKFRAVMQWLQDRRMVFEASQEVEYTPNYMPRADLMATLNACTPAARTTDLGVLDFMRSRGYGPNIPAGVLPHGWRARWYPQAATHRLIVPTYTGRGELVGFQGRDVRLPPDPKKKTAWPYGYDASGLLFSDPVAARPLLRGESAPDDLLIAEGLTDFLSAAQEADRSFGVLGVASGSASALRLVSIPPSTTVVVGTHDDKAGDRYHQEVADALSPRLVRRIPLHLAS